MTYLQRLEELCKKYAGLRLYIPTMMYKFEPMSPMNNCVTCGRYYYLTKHGIRCERCGEWVCSDCVRCVNENDEEIIEAIEKLEGLETFDRERTETRIDRLNDLLANKYRGFYCKNCIE